MEIGRELKNREEIFLVVQRKMDRIRLIFLLNLIVVVNADHVISLPLKSSLAPTISDVTVTPSLLVNPSQSVNISCSVTGIPPPGHGEILLKKQGNVVQSTSTIMSDLRTTTSVFNIVIHKSYPGPYVCEATTKAGTCRKSFNFTIAVLPKPIAPPFATDIFSNELVIGLNSRRFLGQGPIKMTEVLYKKQNDTTFLLYASDVTFPNDSIAIMNLEPFTLYNFRVVLYRGQISTGMGPPGPIATIRTHCGVPTAGPVILLTYARNDTIYVEWKNPGPKQTRGDIVGYFIYYKQLGVDRSNEWTKVEIARRDVSTATLKTLDRQVVYRVKVQLENCAGKSPFSKEARVTMGRLERPNGPNITLVNKTSKLLEFKWTLPSNAQQYTITKYLVSFAEELNKTPNAFRFTAHTLDTHKSFTGLAPFTSYRFKVVAFNHEGAGVESVLTATTSESSPTQVVDIKVSKIGFNHIYLRWKPPVFPNGIIRRYEVQISNNRKLWSYIGGQKFVNTTFFHADSLEQYTVYHFRVRGITVSDGVWSDVIVARTMSIRPLKPPRTVDTEGISPQSVLVTWEPPPATSAVGNVTSYKIIYTDDTRQNEEYWKSKIVPGKQRSFKIEGMRAYTIYVIKVAAITIGIGPYSDGYTVQTAKLGLPPPPTDVEALNVTSSTITVTWSVMSGYHITIVKIRHQAIGSKAVTSLVEVKQNETIITNLKPSTTYELEFLSRNYIGYSSGNPVLSVKTLEKADRLEGDSNGPIRFEDTFMFKVLVSGSGGLLLICIIFTFATIRRCRRQRKHEQRTRSYSHAESDTGSNNIRLSTFGSASQDGLLRNPNYNDFFINSGMTSRSGTLLSSHSMRSSRAPSTHSVQIFPDHLIIAWENIVFEDIPLGVGNFGQVVKAVVTKDEQKVESAVKMLKDGSTLDDKRDFLAELDTMVRIGQHKNVITLVGACEHDNVMYLCTEFAPNGNLLQYLRKSRIDDGELEIYTNLSQNQLLQFASDVTQGMAYLSEKQLIHRDLAARNILMGQGNVCKVADFGLSRGEGIYVKKTVSRLPIRWMAIESLNYNVYTTKSDVWSFGVLLWEIVSLGGTPYCGMSCAELYEKLPGGFRMEKPLNCDNEVYALMLRCWKDRPYDRPTFSQLCIALERMCDARSSRNYVNTAIFDDFCFASIDVNEEEG